MKPLFINIAKYGTLLGLFLILATTARNFYIQNLFPLDAYIGLTALVFLIAGGFAVWRFNKLSVKPQQKTFPKLTQLSQRENDVLTFLTHGYSNKEIATHLNVSQNTVKTHLKNIYSKLGVNNRTQAAAEAKLINIVNDQPLTQMGDD